MQVELAFTSGDDIQLSDYSRIKIAVESSKIIWYTTYQSFAKAGVAQWQSSSLPSWLRGFDSLRPLHLFFRRSGEMADAADSKSAARECVRVRVPPPAPLPIFSAVFFFLYQSFHVSAQLHRYAWICRCALECDIMSP